MSQGIKVNSVVLTIEFDKLRVLNNKSRERGMLWGEGGESLQSSVLDMNLIRII